MNQRPETQTTSPKPRIIKPKPQTLNPKPQTLTFKRSTRHAAGRSGRADIVSRGGHARAGPQHDQVHLGARRLPDLGVLSLNLKP